MTQQLQQASESKDCTGHIEINAALVEVQGRALRAAEALYRTTDLFSDNEPLKWSLRDSAVRILQTASTFNQNPSFSDFREAKKIEKIIHELLIKMELAASGMFIARKNFEVLEREYIALRDAVSSVDSNGDSGRGMLPPTIPRMEIVTEKEQSSSTLSWGSRRKLAENVKNQASRDNSGQMSERKSSILRLIGGRGPSGVGDIARSIGAGISEKTIQRDLGALVAAGFLKKEGEKRWRRYYT